MGSKPVITVVGVAASAEYIWPAASTQEIFPDPEQFGVFFVDESLVAGIQDSSVVRETLVLYDEGADVEATDARVRDAATKAGATSILTQADHPSNATLQLDVEGFGQMAIAFPILFLTAAGLAMYVLLTRLVVSQRSTIGTLRASGIGPRAIRNHYLGFGLILGTTGAVLGAAVGVVIGARITSLYTGLLDIPDTVVAFRPLTLLVGIAFGIVAGLLAAYVPAVRSGSHVYTAGQLPLRSGTLIHEGKVGGSVTPEEAVECARQCALNAMAAVNSIVPVDEVKRVVKVVVFVASDPSFTGQPAVANGASELLGEVFADAGVHARSAVGVSVLPLDAPVEVEIQVELTSA